jgi:hypothetical protein
MLGMGTVPYIKGIKTNSVRHLDYTGVELTDDDAAEIADAVFYSWGQAHPSHLFRAKAMNFLPSRFLATHELRWLRNAAKNAEKKDRRTTAQAGSVRRQLNNSFRRRRVAAGPARGSQDSVDVVKGAAAVVVPVTLQPQTTEAPVMPAVPYIETIRFNRKAIRPINVHVLLGLDKNAAAGGHGHSPYSSPHSTFNSKRLFSGPMRSSHASSGTAGDDDEENKKGAFEIPRHTTRAGFTFVERMLFRMRMVRGHLPAPMKELNIGPKISRSSAPPGITIVRTLCLPRASIRDVDSAKRVALLASSFLTTVTLAHDWDKKDVSGWETLDFTGVSASEAAADLLVSYLARRARSLTRQTRKTFGRRSLPDKSFHGSSTGAGGEEGGASRGGSSLMTFYRGAGAGRLRSHFRSIGGLRKSRGVRRARVAVASGQGNGQGSQPDHSSVNPSSLLRSSTISRMSKTDWAHGEQVHEHYAKSLVLASMRLTNKSLRLLHHRWLLPLCHHFTTYLHAVDFSGNAIGVGGAALLAQSFSAPAYAFLNKLVLRGNRELGDEGLVRITQALGTGPENINNNK